MNIYVGNLDFKVSENDLEELFGEYGTVDSCKIITDKYSGRSKGFGFITPDEGGNDLFVHHSEIKTSGYASLDEGQKVEFEVGEGKKGPCATNVIPG